jgi:hypothetical protein
VFDVTGYDNDTQMVVAQNEEDSGFGSLLWSRFDWAMEGSQLWVCHSTWNADTELDAIDTPAADSTSPASTGCRGTSAWTALVPTVH